MFDQPQTDGVSAEPVSNGQNPHGDLNTLETDLLIVGTGPAGASLACFLASHGLKGVMISAAPGSADTPRAHITNMAALECLRDIGLEETCVKGAVKGDFMRHTRWCRTMAGEEFARIYSWGNDPRRKIPLVKRPGQGLAINVLVKVDLSHVVENRVGNLHWVMQPDEDHPAFGWTGIVRMVRPWNEWMFILFPAPGAGVEFETSGAEYLVRVKQLIGDDSIPVEILGVSKWFINEIVAEYYSDGNVFCLGDAVHRHPPLNGLGSNTCVQDAFNLAWKIAYVMKGLAQPALLDSYSAERQPVGHGVITRANQGLRDHAPVWEALGMMDPSLEVRKQQFAELASASEQGVARRARLQAAVEGTAHEFHGLGIEMNQRYDSDAVYPLDEGARPPLPEDPVLQHDITTYPGSRLPHAWLNTRLQRTPGSTFSGHPSPSSGTAFFGEADCGTKASGYQ
ncbi:hypothetical protein B0A49_00365 [Cryomyces minteri]|uniref:FAD-binding domain-containing protein n=1 Tax=Cryomyces minteri TaxID=331657 RepID=A0A4U0Y0T1_9PEZI|nr:hypothetical protein B0A49_00365 [Cryomyces minteri]